jgi:hypothetical protein
MRLLIDIEDADRSFVAESRKSEGHVVLCQAPGRAIRAVIVGHAEPHSVAGAGDRYKALYDITLLEGMPAA